MLSIFFLLLTSALAKSVWPYCEDITDEGACLESKNECVWCFDSGACQRFEGCLFQPCENFIPNFATGIQGCIAWPDFPWRSTICSLVVGICGIAIFISILGLLRFLQTRRTHVWIVRIALVVTILGAVVATVTTGYLIATNIEGYWALPSVIWTVICGLLLGVVYLCDRYQVHCCRPKLADLDEESGLFAL